MKAITKQSDKKTAFTIIELLTVMSIIIILIGLLVPSLNMVKRYAKEVRQKAQFHSIDSAIELFSSNSGWGGYPPSDALDEAGKDYCGAMKLCEAMVGQDLMGFHPNSHFWADCTDGTSGHQLYDNPPGGATLYPDDANNLKARKGPYLQTDSANAYRLWQLYGTGKTSPFTNENLFVLCDVYNRVKNQDTGKGVGMPILYYKANTSNTIHDPNGTFPTAGNDNGYIYNYLDNDELVHLGPAGVTHPLDGTGTNFYKITQDKRISITTGRPYRPDSYILISAGFDGIYGTDDDVFNFEK
jgi:type II secretory pathway pseudopilin PulG